MFHLLVAIFLAGYPAFALAHPGKTDRQGGHRCFKGCAEWDLYYDEYHLHDKEGKPIRVKASRAKTVKRDEPVSAGGPPVAETPAIPAPVPAMPAAVIPSEAPVSVSPGALWALLALLFCLLLARRRRSRDGS